MNKDRRKQSQKPLILALILVGHVAWFTLWGTLGYFFGLRGVGVGWPAFWAVGGINLACVVVMWVIVSTVFAGWSLEDRKADQ